MNRIAEALKHAVITDDDNTLARVVRENLPAIVKALDTVDEVNTALMRIMFNVPKPMESRVDMAHQCFDLENPDAN